MANEKREQRKKERQVRRIRKADERAGILTAMDAKRAELSKTPPEEISTPEPEKSGKINMWFGESMYLGNQDNERGTFVQASNQPSEEAATKAVKAQEELLKKSGWKDSQLDGEDKPFTHEQIDNSGKWRSFINLKEPIVRQDTTAVNIPTSGSTLLDAVSKGDGTIGELNKAVDDAKTANKEEIETKNQLAGMADQAAKLIAEEEQQVQTEEKTLPGDGKTLAGQQSMQVDKGTRPKFDQTDTVDDIRSKIMENNRDLFADAPKAVLENLTAEDYYPNIRKDIAAGTYQGRYLGSATIFAAPGARVPLGLYDARQRALKEAAKQKQKQIEDILAVPETSPQYQALYDESFYDMLESELKRLDYNFDAFSTDPQALRNMARYKAKAREITESVTFANAILTAGADNATYVPQEMIDLSNQIKYAQINNLDAILAGEANAVEPLRKAQIYKDLVPDVQELAKDLLNPERMGQSPINLRTGGKYDSPAWINERNQFFDKVASGIGWDEYATGIVKYFGGDYETMIENLVKGRGGSQDQIEPMKKMFASMIQNQTILSYKTVDNDEVEVMKLRERQRQFDINREDKMNNFWGNVNNAMTNFVNPETGKSYEQELAEAQKITDSKKRAAKMAELAQYYSPGREVYVDKKTGAYTTFLPPSPDQVGKPASPKPTTASGGTGLAYIPVSKNGKTVYYTINQIANSKENSIYIDGKPITKAQIANYKALKGTVYTKVVGTEVQKGYTGANGQVIYLKADGSNLEEYNAAEKKHTIVKQIEKPFLRKETTDKVKGKTFYNVELPGQMVTTTYDVNNKVDQQVLNNQHGYKPQAAAQETFDDGSTYNVSGSSSSTD